MRMASKCAGGMELLKYPAAFLVLFLEAHTISDSMVTPRQRCLTIWASEIYTSTRR